MLSCEGDRPKRAEPLLSPLPPRLPSQSLPEAAAAAERPACDAEKLCRLPQAETLAVVAALHQGEGTWGSNLSNKETAPWVQGCSDKWLSLFGPQLSASVKWDQSAQPLLARILW